MSSAKSKPTVVDSARIKLIFEYLKEKRRLWLTPNPTNTVSRPWWQELGMTERQRDNAIEMLILSGDAYISCSSKGMQLIWLERDLIEDSGPAKQKTLR